MQAEGKSRELLKYHHKTRSSVDRFPLGLLSVPVWFVCGLCVLVWFLLDLWIGFRMADSSVWGQCGVQLPAGTRSPAAAREPGWEFATRQGWNKGQEERCCSQCLSVSNHADKNHTTPSAQQKISLSIYPYNITIQASGHLLSLSKQKSSLKTLVMQVMAWNHPFSRKMVILHLESKEDWLDVQSYYVSQIHSPLVIWEQLLDNSVSFVVSVLFGAWVCFSMQA